MLQRGRKSGAAIAVAGVSGAPARLKPPPSLSAAERVVFIDLVEAVDPKHFRASDMPLLCAYVHAVVLEASAAKKLAKDSKALVLWEKSSRAMVALAARLRLCPQSRLDPKTVARQRVVPTAYPWDEGHHAEAAE
jgi:hypothetical protein